MSGPTLEAQVRLTAREQRLLDAAKAYLDSHDGLDRANMGARELAARLVVALLHPDGVTL